MDPQRIKEYCEEALDIAEQFGVQEGLAYLIGEKFCAQFYEHRKTQNKLKYLYPEEKQDGKNPLPLGIGTFKLDYKLTLHQNYRQLLNKLKCLEKSQGDFVRKIKTTFDLDDILEYLNSFPRLGFKQKSHSRPEAGREEDDPIFLEEILSEVEDILIVNDLKKLFADA